MAERKTRWLEVAVNGPWTRRHQPLIPITEREIIDESVECVKRGAAIVHVHAYDPATGTQKDDPDIYTRIIEGIRSRVDAIVYPTVPFAAKSEGPGASPLADRFSHLEVLGRRGLLEWSVVDLGSLNFVTDEEIGRGADGFVHANSVAEIRHNLGLAARFGFHPSYTVYEPGFMRFGARIRRAIPGLPAPVYRLMFTDAYTFGFRPQPAAMEVYRTLLAECDPGAEWMVAGLGVDVDPLFEPALHAGGHVRVGLEDLPARALRRNPELTAEAVQRMVAAGFEPASPAEVRAQLR